MVLWSRKPGNPTGITMKPDATAKMSRVTVAMMKTVRKIARILPAAWHPTNL
jgi:hypothetical protein